MPATPSAMCYPYLFMAVVSYHFPCEETTLMLSFAHLWDIPQGRLLHIRWGAQLHDIGKVGIPDAILHKKGSLTVEEQAVIRMHPIYAYELLYHVSYLRPALDIPYYHHEKWDGSGYPQGLKGKQIPLAARLFAIVDVWDALLSDRPYRNAWSTDKTIAYIHGQSGKHFDPKVVRMFGEFRTSSYSEHSKYSHTRYVASSESKLTSSVWRWQ